MLLGLPLLHAVVEEKAWWAVAAPIDCVLLSCSFVTNENDLNAEVKCKDTGLPVKQKKNI